MLNLESKETENGRRGGGKIRLWMKRLTGKKGGGSMWKQKRLDGGKI